MKKIINLTNNVNSNDYKFVSPYDLNYKYANSEEPYSFCEAYPYDLLSAKRTKENVDKVFDDLWTDIFEIINDYVGYKGNVEFWKYFSSYDFYYLISIYFERYTLIKNIISTNKELIFLIEEINDKFYVAKNNTGESIDYRKIVACIDSQILEYFSQPKTIVKLEEVNGGEYKVSTNEKRTIKKILFSIFEFVLQLVARKGGVLVCGSLLSGVEKIKLEHKYGRRVYACRINDRIVNKANIDVNFRNCKLRDIKKNYFSEFEKIFYLNIYRNLSVTFLERFSELQKKNNFIFSLNPKGIIRDSYDEATMMCAALVHGNNGICVNLAHSLEESFRNIESKTVDMSDFLLQWTKEDLFARQNSRNCSSTRLNTISSVSYNNNCDILYVFSDQVGKYLQGEMVAAYRERETFIEYARIPIDLYDNIRKDLRNLINYRIRDEWGRNAEPYIKERCKESSIEYSFMKNGTTLIEKIQSSRLVICETFYTTSFFEALVSNVPVIVVNKNSYDNVNCDAIENIYSELRNVGIVMENGCQAATFINEEYDNIELWWENPKRKLVIDKLRNLCVCRENGDQNQWLYEILEEILEKKDK